MAAHERKGTRIVCGITGWVDFGRDLRAERLVIEAMAATMVNRGPDAGGVWCSVHAAIGHRRLRSGVTIRLDV
jgi:asparagine synthase (glutamine-hydrolysing)